MVVRRGAVRSAAAIGAAIVVVVVVAVAVPAFAEDDIPSQADAASAAESARADLDEAMLAATSGTDGGDDLDAFLAEHPASGQPVGQAIRTLAGQRLAVAATAPRAA